MNEITEKRVAVLIDAENISSKNIDEILDKVSLEGRATVKRIYGDFSDRSKSAQAKSWNNVVADYALNQVQQIQNTHGKNSSDSALIIDAMDLLYSNTIEMMCIVTNDSDFTRLAMRIAESGVDVIGMGTTEQDCSKSFVSACTKFYYISEAKNKVEKPKKTAKKTTAKAESKSDTKADAKAESKPEVAHKATPVPKKVIATIITAIENEGINSDEWANIAPIGSVLYRRFPEFDPTIWNRPKQLSPFLKSLDEFEVAQGEEIGKSSGSYIRIRT